MTDLTSAKPNAHFSFNRGTRATGSWAALSGWKRALEPSGPQPFQAGAAKSTGREIEGQRLVACAAARPARQNRIENWVISLSTLLVHACLPGTGAGRRGRDAKPIAA